MLARDSLISMVTDVKAQSEPQGHRKFATYAVPDWVRHPLKRQRLKVGLLFPGEQNHSVGMLKEVRTRPVVKAMLEMASQSAGFDVEELMLNGPARDMLPTAVNQLLMYVADCAAFELLKELQSDVAENCQAVAGLGVGEYAALYAAGVLSFEQGLSVVKVRGEALQELAKDVEMEAVKVRGIPLEKLERHMKALQKSDADAGVVQPEVHVACYWCPEGYICAGKRSTVLKLSQAVAAEPEVDVRVLPDHLHAGHTPMAKGAAAKVAATLDKLIPAMKPPRCEMFLNKTGWRVPPGARPSSFVEALKLQLCEPIQWESCVTQMLNWGVREFYECGSNRSLRFMMSFYEHVHEAPLEVLRPADFTYSIAV